jgi:hypothetical protein
LQYYHSSTLPGLTNNYTQDNSQPFDRKGYVIRGDFNESSSSQWMGRYNWGNDDQSSQGIGLAGSKTITNYKQWGGSNTRTLSSTLVNDARFGYTKFFNSIGTLSAFTNDVVGALKIPNLKSGAPVTWGIPSVAFTGFTGIGDITDGPFAVDNNTLQFVDKLTWLKGRHTIGMGAEYDRQHFNEVGNQFLPRQLRVLRRFAPGTRRTTPAATPSPSSCSASRSGPASRWPVAEENSSATSSTRSSTTTGR